MNSTSEGQLRVELGFSLLYWMLYFVRPVISINGNVQQARWGIQDHVLPEGRYALSVWFRWLFFLQAGRADLVVDVVHGQVTSVRYRPVFAVPVVGGRMQLVARQVATIPSMRVLP
jgi:hypothetical protein